MFTRLTTLALENRDAIVRLLIDVTLGCAVFLLIFAAARMLFRIRSRDLKESGAAIQKHDLLRMAVPVLNRFAFLANTFSTVRHRKWAADILRRANLTDQWSVELVETLKIASAVAAVPIVSLPSLALGSMPSLPLVLLMAVVLYNVPDVYFYLQADTRMTRIQNALPFLLDLITVSAETGLAFQQAIQNVVTHCSRGWRDGDETQSGERELVGEFDRIANDIRTGRTVYDALYASSERINLEEFKAFTGALMQADRFGTPLTDALRRQSSELRNKLAMRTEARAAKAPVQILVPLIIFIFPVTGWILIGPIIISYMRGELI